MRKFLITLTALASLAMIGSAPAQAFNGGCYRVGLTGYHWYRFCAGPHFSRQGVLFPAARRSGISATLRVSR